MSLTHPMFFKIFSFVSPYCPFLKKSSLQKKVLYWVAKQPKIFLLRLVIESSPSLFNLEFHTCSFSWGWKNSIKDQISQAFPAGNFDSVPDGILQWRFSSWSRISGFFCSPMMTFCSSGQHVSLLLPHHVSFFSPDQLWWLAHWLFNENPQSSIHIFFML